MLIRHALESEHDRILSFVLRDPIGWVDKSTYRRYLASESYGADRVWLAEDDGRIKACAVWYGSRSGQHPLIVDCLWVDPDESDRAALGAAVMDAGHVSFQAGSARSFPEYHLFLKPGWRKDRATCAEVEWRLASARSVGLRGQLERLRYEWTAGAGLPPSSERLIFSTESDDSVFLNIFERVAVESLDQGTRDGVTRLGLDGQARETLACYRGMRGDRAWWRIAHTPGGQLVGFTIPSANEDYPVIGYLGVVPEMRGRGYAVDLLTEATHILAAQGAERIRADTDTTNLPMAAAFQRARYRNFSVRLVFSA